MGCFIAVGELMLSAGFRRYSRNRTYVAASLWGSSLRNNATLFAATERGQILNLMPQRVAAPRPTRFAFTEEVQERPWESRKIVHLCSMEFLQFVIPPTPRKQNNTKQTDKGCKPSKRSAIFTLFLTYLAVKIQI